MRNPSFFEAIQMFFVVLKGAFMTAYGILRLRRLRKPIITVFGGSGAYENGKYVHNHGWWSGYHGGC